MSISNTLDLAVSMSCLDFAFLIPGLTSVHEKRRRRTKFRCFTQNPFCDRLVKQFQAKTAAQILSSHKQCKSTVQIIAHRGASGMRPAHSIAGIFNYAKIIR